MVKKKKKILQVILSNEDYEEFKFLSKTLGISMAGVARIAVKKYFEEELKKIDGGVMNDFE